MNEQERSQYYVDRYYDTFHKCPKNNIIDDSLNAFCYSFKDYSEKISIIKPYYEQSHLEHNMAISLDKMMEIIDDWNVEPFNVLEIGCGTSALSILYDKLGINYTGVDFSPDLSMITEKTRHLLPDDTDATIINSTIEEFIELNVDKIKEVDCFLFVESIEHLMDPMTVVKQLSEINEKFRIVVTNFIHNHPIPRDSNWNHVSTINDESYDNIVELLGTEVYRNKSHLIVDKI